ncbi:hypothetical protein [Sulfuriroseicoccus oceanibius]|uniref:Uncharacterized protein n=1 Tax=Sulfuriroseicoccus oceanibius TaxID=2707525 RepID=A0A6B3LCV2_9BACT|nr:hypothetical protein [Sulfuriroseicoccus oceanibius]QQL45719.1 hypothetical protein G3M56_003785 [Sulfuriroseicoccus oceanibius]
MKALTTLAALTAAALVPAMAQESSEEEITYAVAPLETDDSNSALGGAEFSAGAGYASSHNYRGVDYGQHAGEFDVKMKMPVSDFGVLTVGGRYIGTNESFNEGQAFTSLQLPLGPAAAFLGYRYFGNDGLEDFPLDTDSRHEIGTMLGSRFFSVDFSVAYFYDTGYEGHYTELRGSKAWALGQNVHVKASAAASYGFDYQFDGSGFNHFQASLEFPIDLNESVELSPFVTAVLPGSDLTTEDDTVVGGMNLKVSF